MFEFLQADEGMRVDAPLADHVGNGGVVGDAIDPGAQGTARVPGRKTAPEGEVNLLEEVAEVIRVGLVGTGEAFEGGAVRAAASRY